MMYPYYEIHLIVGGDFDLGTIQAICQRHGFWFSVLDADTSNEDSAGDLILTSRAPRLDASEQMIREIWEDLTYWDIPVKRYKVETCSVDSKIEDSLGLGVGPRDQGV